MISSFIEILKSYGKEQCLVYMDKSFSYNDLVKQVYKYNKEISNHIQKGRVVGVIVDYSFHSIAMFLALALNRNIIIPLSLDAKQKHDEFIKVGLVEYIVQSDNDHTLHFSTVTTNDTCPFYKKLQDKRHAGLVLFSSGSSGTPKGIVHDLNQFLTAYEKSGKSLRTLIFLQMDHIGGLNTLFYNLRNKGLIVAPKSKSPVDVCTWIQNYKVELLPTSPTFLNLLILSGLISQFDLSSLKLITYGTEPMPESTLFHIKEHLPHVVLKQTYGLSETGILKTKSKSDNSLWVKLGGEDFDVKIENNKLLIRSKVSMMGYLNADDPFEEDGYINTGDVVEKNGDWLKILGRESELINVGGNKVFPAEIESVLQQMKEVEDAVVYGQANPLTGQMVSTIIKTRDKIELSDFKIAMRKYCRKHLESYKIPVKVQLSEEKLYSERFKKKRNFKGAKVS